MRKIVQLLAATAVAAGGAAGSSALADPIGDVVTVCGETSCDVYDCPQGADPDSGNCTYLYSYPRQREVSED